MPKQKEIETKQTKQITNFETKLNKYGFIHIPKKTMPSLPFMPEKPLIAQIDGDQLTIKITTKTATELLGVKHDGE